MKMLTVAQLRKVIKGLPADTKIFLGDDEELNGVHQAYYCQTEDLNNIEEYSCGQAVKESYDAYLQFNPEKNPNRVALLIS